MCIVTIKKKEKGKKKRRIMRACGRMMKIIIIKKAQCVECVSVVDDIYIYIYYIGSCVSVVMVVIFGKYENDIINYL